MLLWDLDLRSYSYYIEVWAFYSNSVINITCIKQIYIDRSLIWLLHCDILLKGSMNQKDWVMLVNHKHYFCRSWQYLYFEPRVVLYIRIVGTNNTVNKVSLLNYDN